MITILKPLEAVISVPFSRSYKRRTVCQKNKIAISRVEAGSNTSTVVALRVVGGDEKGNLESETVKHGHESHANRTPK
jgi:hypothetical protein